HGSVDRQAERRRRLRRRVDAGHQRRALRDRVRPGAPAAVGRRRPGAGAAAELHRLLPGRAARPSRPRRDAPRPALTAPGDARAAAALQVRVAGRADLPSLARLIEAYMAETFQRAWGGSLAALERDGLGARCQALL